VVGALLFLAVAIATGNQVFGVLFWFSFTGLLCLGIPAAAGIAILKYRLYDLDVVIKKTVVFGVLVGFVTIVYVALVVGVGAAVGRKGNGTLTLAAAVVVALAFQPIRARARHLADRIVYGERATPYEVLSEFSDRLAGAYSTEDVLPRMVKILAAGTGATTAGVWLRVGDELRPAASWPIDETGPVGVLPLEGQDLPQFPGNHPAFSVQHQGELLGAITVALPPTEPLTPSQEKLIRDLASQAGLVLRNVRLTEELRAYIEELRASRQRIVTAQDAWAKALERNIHDGAQQQLVALAVKLRLAESMLARDPERARLALSELQADAVEALENLRDLARGIYPPLLADQGLTAALRAQARKAAVPVTVEAGLDGRYPQEVEAAVYFCCLEALQNVAKYSHASCAVVRLAASDHQLEFAVQDDGEGFDPNETPLGTGLQGMVDRVEALGGTLDIRSQPGRGTTVVGRIPTRQRR
jgi:signal transduction histidine kinase